ncbi:MAG: class I SAM-dependent methyltransferase [Flavobacteriaceae bacterium]|nr:class I SAM-dependent methyltransferase [Flavobacteriaceae bacterium]
MSFSKHITSNYQPKRLAVKLNTKGEQHVVKGHPWVFSNSIVKINDDAQSGDLAIVFSKNKNKLIGLGLYDANSPIRIKMLTTSSANIDETFFRSRMQVAYDKRASLLATQTNSYRLIFGENDGFPGLIADVYAKVLVVKLYSEIWLPYLQTILPVLRDISKSKTVVLRLSRALENSNRHNFTDGDVIFGTLAHEVVVFIEHGINFSANVIKGHKTGYFLDHRANRKQVGEWSKGKTVLDVFSYAGGFSVHALANNASEVTSLDISKHALEIAKQNGKLNAYKGIHKTIAGDAFEVMQQLIDQKKTYDVVVIDPPSFAKQATEIPMAKKKYAQLAQLGVQLTAKKGLLVLASCSSRVQNQTFYDINTKALNATNRNYKVVLKTTHDTDHPVNFAEGAYLKCAYYRFVS